MKKELITIPVDGVELKGFLDIPEEARGVVLFAHGSGSGRNSPRNQFVAEVLKEQGLGTLLMDLLTEEEEQVDLTTRHLRFDIPLLAGRLEGATQWLHHQSRTKKCKFGYFGASTGAAAALIAAAKVGALVGAVVSRGGRPDLAGAFLQKVIAPTLLIVGGEDDVVIKLNEEALTLLQCTKKLTIIPGATHLFEEPGTLEQAAGLAAAWFTKYLHTLQ